MAVQSMSLKVVNKINSRLALLYRKLKFLALALHKVILLFNLILIMHFQPGILTSPKK